MDTKRYDLSKNIAMVMGGDQPSFTKTELNARDAEKGYGRVSPTVPVLNMMLTLYQTSRTEKPSQTAFQVTSDNAIRVLDTKRRLQSIDVVNNSADMNNSANRALFQAALGSFHWPPYLLAVWVAVLVLTHALHCLVNMLEKALPRLKNICSYFHSWVEETWKAEGDQHHKMYPIMLALVTSLLYTVYYSLYAIYSVSVWAVEPLGGEFDDKTAPAQDIEEKCTNYMHLEEPKPAADDKS